MNELIKFPVADTAIAALSSKYMQLKVSSINDKQGLAAVHDARMEVKGYRVDVEKTRKALKADALAFGQKVDTEAKRLTALLAPIEEHLEQEESIVAREEEAATTRGGMMDLQAELLHLVATARGEPTEELFEQIDGLRKGKVWPHAAPRNVEALRRLLLALSAQGQIVNVPGLGWVLASAVPRTERRTFEELELFR